MTIPRRLTAVAISAAVTALPLISATTLSADAASYHYKNCTALHRDFPHGVGKNHAKDRHRSGKPVTNFKHSTAIYRAAVAYHPDLDRDHDGIACEKH